MPGPSEQGPTILGGRSAGRRPGGRKGREGVFELGGGERTRTADFYVANVGMAHFDLWRQQGTHTKYLFRGGFPVTGLTPVYTHLQPPNARIMPRQMEGLASSRATSAGSCPASIFRGRAPRERSRLQDLFLGSTIQPGALARHGFCSSTVEQLAARGITRDHCGHRPAAHPTILAISRRELAVPTTGRRRRLEPRWPCRTPAGRLSLQTTVALRDRRRQPLLETWNGQP